MSDDAAAAATNVAAKADVGRQPMSRLSQGLAPLAMANVER
ncbi:MAG TPA: hypothetical protein VGO16_01805 [Pseudonocardiaceae bacterium]|nr:hypothetical protein [Pseudonocardiaceae bacterium]